MPLARVLALTMALLAVFASPAFARTDVDPVGVWPLQPPPEVVRGFDPPEVPWASGHRGADLLGVVGQEVHAAIAGRVRWAAVLAGRGVVVVDHGDTRTTYEPVAASVRVGEQVEAGAVLGRLEIAGSHCLLRACLHWGWLRGETYLDPLGLVEGERVRLLPLWRDEPVPTVAFTSGWVAPYAALVLRLLELAARSPPADEGAMPGGVPAGRRAEAGRS